MAKTKKPQGSNIVAFRVSDADLALFESLAERASQAAGGVPISSAEMARTAALRGAALLNAELPGKMERSPKP